MRLLRRQLEEEEYVGWGWYSPPVFPAFGGARESSSTDFKKCSREEFKLSCRSNTTIHIPSLVHCIPPPGHLLAMPYSRPPSRGRSQPNNPDHPQLPLATSRLLAQSDNQTIPLDDPPADPNVPVQLGSSTPVELGVFPNTHWLEEFARVRAESRRSRFADQALASSSSSSSPSSTTHPRSELARPSGSTRTPLPSQPIRLTFTMDGEEEPSAPDLETLRARVLAEIDMARWSLESAALGNGNTPARPDPTTTTTTNSTTNLDQTAPDFSFADPQSIPNPTTNTTTTIPSPANPNPSTDPDPNPSRTYRWMDILTL